jgi:hypothetical protein
MSVLLRLHGMRCDAAAAARRLLCLLLLRLCALPADPSGASAGWRGFVLRAVKSMPAAAEKDWVGNARTNVLAWGLPHAAILAGLLLPVPWRAAVWSVALAWMGVACILNSRRCGRTHCRYTGPYYLAMIVPVLAFAAGVVPLGFYGWLALGVTVLAGSKIIWWTTERSWGKFS